MYLRAKRQKQTIFVYMEPNKAMGDIRRTIARITGRPATEVRLLAADRRTEYRDGDTVQSSELKNDAVIFFAFPGDE